MPQISVSVRCEQCKTIDARGDVTCKEMVGSQYMYERQNDRVQLRTFTCPDCGCSVTVELDFTERTPGT